MIMRKASKLDRFLPAKLLKTMRAHQTEAEQLSEIWPAIVGKELAAHSTPASYQEQVLTVLAENAVWASKLRHCLPDITAKCRAHKKLKLASLKTIKIKIGLRASSDHDDNNIKRRRSKIPEASARIILESAKDIKDESLRASLERLGSAPGIQAKNNK